MNTLSNVIPRRGESNPPGARIVSDIIPEARSLKKGVSVKYVPDCNKSWYVFRASYGRVDKASDFIIEDGTFVYVARRNVRKIVNGKKINSLEVLIPNILFVYATEAKAKEYIKGTPALSYLTYYYNHFKYDRNQNNLPLTISCKEMENFIIATCNNSEHLKFVDESQCHFKGGEIVRVTEGAFKGVEGRVARVSGQQRVILELNNIGLISTAYIPTAFIQIIEEKII